jgi:sulfur carrier protein
MITLTVNGERTELEKGCLLDLLTRDKKIDTALVVIEFNGKIIDRAAWKDTELKEDDRIEILSFVGGG